LRAAYGGGAGLSLYNSSSSPRFDIYLNSAPRSICMSILVQVTQMAVTSEPAWRGISGPMDRLSLGYAATNAGAWATTIFPVSLSTASTACNLSSNQIVLTFGFPA